MENTFRKSDTWKGFRIEEGEEQGVHWAKTYEQIITKPF